MRNWFAVCNVCSAGTSVVCMGSMGAAAVAAGAAGATSVAGMAGMAGAADTQAPQATVAAPYLTTLLEQAGLGFLNQMPDPVLRPIFIILLLLSVGTAYGGFRTHRRPQALLLTGLSGALLYGSIYVWMSEPLYYVSLAGMLGSALWGTILAKGAGEAAPNNDASSEEGRSWWAKRRWLLLGPPLFLAVMLYGILSLDAAPSVSVSQGTAPFDELSAPDFVVETSKGAFRLSEQRGKGVVLVFTSAGCVSCGRKLSTLAKLYSEYRSKGLEAVVLDVISSDTKEAFVAYLDYWEASDLPWAKDINWQVTLAYTVRRSGTVIGIGREGRIVYNNSDPLAEPNEVMRKAVETTLQ